jgi:hypothetical protein
LANTGGGSGTSSLFGCFPASEQHSPSGRSYILFLGRVWRSGDWSLNKIRIANKISSKFERIWTNLEYEKSWTWTNFEIVNKIEFEQILNMNKFTMWTKFEYEQISNQASQAPWIWAQERYTEQALGKYTRIAFH